MAPTQTDEVVDLRADALEVTAPAPDTIYQEFTSSGHSHASRSPLEKLCAKVFLKLDDLAVYGGRRDVEHFRSPTQAPAPRHFIEIDGRSTKKHFNTPVLISRTPYPKFGDRKGQDWMSLDLRRRRRGRQHRAARTPPV
jgi:hypothetical protein